MQLLKKRKKRHLKSLKSKLRSGNLTVSYIGGPEYFISVALKKDAFGLVSNSHPEKTVAHESPASP